MLKILTAPNRSLNSLVKPITKIDDQIKLLVKEMEKTLIVQDDPPGVGLAAPQVGENLALFVVKPTTKTKTMVFINPRIIKTFENRRLKMGMETGQENRNKRIDKKPSSIHQLPNSPPNPPSKDHVKLEGCLSIPRIWGPVRRAAKILVEFQDLTGKTQKKWFSGLTATIIQHEIDHLNGILFTQRTLEQKLPLYEEKNGQLEKIDY